MKKMLSDYWEIYKKFPKNECLTKEERKQRFDLLCLYDKTPYETIKIEDFEAFIQEFHQKIEITSAFFKKIVPVLKEDIKNGGVRALKLLTKQDFLNENLDDNLYFRFYTICQEELGEITDLIDLLLERDSDYLPAIQTKFAMLESVIENNLHELPWGVLLKKEEVPEALNDLKIYRQLGEKLQKNAQEIEEQIREAEFYYLAWQNYLENRASYENFEHFLKINSNFSI